MCKWLKEDIDAVLAHDPAARNRFEVFMTYSGLHALMYYRVAHFFQKAGLKFLARATSQWARFITNIEIHPAAEIGRGVFIDHGAGVVIGETAVVGNNVVIYQGATLGGTGKDHGKRHPTIEDDVMISCGAKVLGPFTVGKGSKIGAGSVVLSEVPPYSTVVGIPGRIVRQHGEKVTEEMDQKIPDPVSDELEKLAARISELEAKLGIEYADRNDRD